MTAAVQGTTHTLRTRVDGTVSLTVEIEPRHAQDAFRLFGSPGTSVALAVLTSSAQEAQEDYGHYYAVLYKVGWWHNPRVIQAFEVDPSLPPSERIEAIKQEIYSELGDTSLKNISPYWFRSLCGKLDIDDTLPAVFGS